MSRIFISYRRADSARWANKLYGHLSMRFGKDLVFQDVDDIKGGEDFLEAIRKELESCLVFLVIIGPHWLIDGEGHRRVDEPEDVLRMEVTDALSSEGTVIPVLVGGAGMPLSEDLPDSLIALARRQAIYLRDDQWIPDVEVLIERLRELVLPTIEHMPLPQAKQELYEMQLRYFDLLDDRKAAEALELGQKTQAYLNRVLPLYPQDSELKVTRGYLFKNEAMALMRLGRYDEAEAALDQGELIFRTMIDERPRDPGAWNGLGSVTAVSGNYEEALGYIDRALEIMPGYSAAIRDREQILRIMDRKSQPPLDDVGAEAGEELAELAAEEDWSDATAEALDYDEDLEVPEDETLISKHEPEIDETILEDQEVEKIEEDEEPVMAEETAAAPLATDEADEADTLFGIESTGFKEETAVAEPVHFTVYNPQELRPTEWYPFLAYVHRPSAKAMVESDSSKRMEEKVPYRKRDAEATRDIAREAEILIVPELSGCRFNPTYHRLLWIEDWHCGEFKIQASPDLPDFELEMPAKGRVAFYVESVLVGEVPIWSLLTDKTETAASGERLQTSSAEPYDAIFVSYSHEDGEIVDRIGRAYKALGMDFLRDVEILRSGEEWNPALLELIETADIFQLYWSEAARISRYVEQEWRHALAQGRERFIRPLYWKKPMPEPPRELSGLHFAFYPVAE
jgi:tetratricopeptide (TPR) repeat protein